MPLVPLTREKFAIVDDEDFHLVSLFRWHARVRRKKDLALSPIWYAATSPGSGQWMLMHRLILGAIDGEDVDHKNHDGLDNRRDNIRLCSNSMNAANRRIGKSAASGFRGVSITRQGTFSAYVCVNYKILHCGVFADAEEAARVRDRVAFEHFGEFATLNFPLEDLVLA